MSVAFLQLTAHDPIIARDGRPFGADQGNRMHGLGWPLPSVVAGSFRTALVKAHAGYDFTGRMPLDLMNIEVAGVFPTTEQEFYLPAPNDALAEPTADGKGIKTVHRISPQECDGGCDFPNDLPLLPVGLSAQHDTPDFKPADVPAWWPIGQLTKWLLGECVTFDHSFLTSAIQEIRDHVCIDADRGAAAEGQLFATAGLNVTHLPRFSPKDNSPDVKLKPFADRFAEILLSARVTHNDARFGHLDQFDTWHPLGGERRLVHWQRKDTAELWTCPNALKSVLASATDAPRIRMVLTTPAIFQHGWRPNWLDAATLTGKPFKDGPTLKLVGIRNGRWQAVSGWSLAKVNDKGELDPKGKPGPKPIRRMVPAGSVYFFETSDNAASLAEHWLQTVSDGEQERRDGFGLAVWGIW